MQSCDSIANVHVTYMIKLMHGGYMWQLTNMQKVHDLEFS